MYSRKSADVLDAQRVGILRRHAGALRDRRQAELLRVAALGPHGRPAVLQDEADDVVFGPHHVPQHPGDRVGLRVPAGDGVQLIRGQTVEALVEHAV